jgi:DNA primase
MSNRNDDLKEALERLDLQAWLDREGVDYRTTRGSRGVQLNVRECPCCGGNTWKVYLGAESGLGNCFSGSCQVKFNRWSFIRHTLGHLSTKEVIEHIKDFAKELGWRPVRRESLAVNLDTELKLPKSYELPIGGKNLKYLINRGIGADMAGYFRLRFCKEGFFAYEHEGKRLKQFYNNRILIPIFDLEGDLVSFQGRDITGDADKKYLFPPGFASTGKYLYNGHNAWGAEHIAIGEGAFDVYGLKLALDSQPDTRAVVPVGSFGKHLSHGDDESQLGQLLKLKERGLRIATFMWDGERQAFEDAIEAALIVRKHGITARVATLPQGKDPNEATQEEVLRSFWTATSIDTATAVKLKMGRQYL